MDRNDDEAILIVSERGARVATLGRIGVAVGVGDLVWGLVTRQTSTLGASLFVFAITALARTHVHRAEFLPDGTVWLVDGLFGKSRRKVVEGPVVLLGSGSATRGLASSGERDVWLNYRDPDDTHTESLLAWGRGHDRDVRIAASEERSDED
jgi:hypothetical protein